LAKLRRKDLLKKQDQFLNKSWSFLEWSKTHLRHLLWGGIGLLAALLAVLAVRGYSQSYEQAAEKAFSQAYLLYNMALRSETDPALDARAVEALLKIGQEYDKSLSAAQARIALAHLFMERREYSQALPVLERLSQESGLPRELAAIGQGARGQCLEQLERLEEADQAYQTAANLSAAHSSACWLLAQARVLARQGKTESAQALYQRLAAESLSPLLRDSASLALADMGQTRPTPSQ
jgi:predicted negative regulator of RcsB-dependent stress response